MIPDASTMDRPIARLPMTTRMRVMLSLVIIGLVIAIVWFVPNAQRWARAERVIDMSRIKIAQVTRGDLERDVAVQGRVVASLHPTLYSPAQGIVTVLVRPGTKVKKGQELATIDSPDLATKLGQEKTTLLSFKTELSRQKITTLQSGVRAKQFSNVLGLKLETAKRALLRAQRLREEGVSTQVEFDKANDEVELAALEVRNAEETATLEKKALAFESRNRQLQVERQETIVTDLERQIADLRIRAPFDGMIGAVAVQNQDAVNRHQPLMTIVNLTTFDVEGELPEGYARDVAMGTAAEITVQGKPHSGHVTMVSPEVQGGQVRVTVAFEGDSPAGLRQNERLSVRIVLERRTNVLRLPRGPFLECGGGRKAYVVDNGIAVLRNITTDATSVSDVEITGGLQVGERVVVSDTNMFEGAQTILIRQ
jgi:HlyD family secretion protein